MHKNINEMNNENLKPIHQSHDEATRNGRKGGIASGKARRERRRFYHELELALNQTTIAPDGRVVTLKELGAINLALLFASGDLKAIQLVLEITGEKYAYLEDDGEDDF